jgi:hypothetical protein
MGAGIEEAMAGSKGPCSAWAQAAHAAEKRGDHKGAQLARTYYRYCTIDAARAAGARDPTDQYEPTHKRIKQRKKNH